jgi:hypothetical protein
MAAYRCKDPTGVVHVAHDQSWRAKLDWNECDLGDKLGVDEAGCGYTNFMDRVKEPITCITCLTLMLSTDAIAPFTEVE